MHTVTVEIALIGDAAAKYKLKAGEETFTIGGNINKAYPKLTVTLSKTLARRAKSFFRFCLSRVLRKTPR